MKCPACVIELQMMSREGIEIDYCPTCRGVWLDRGELDKLIERSSQTAAPVGKQRRSRDDDDDHDDDDDLRGGRQNYGQNQTQRPQGKRESFWGEFFDFG